jgi:uncharacterized protein
MLQAAKMGDIGAQVDVGYMYDTAAGVAHDEKAALYWYKRAYRRGCAYAASNIGTIWRDRKSFQRAIYWFERAIEMNNGDDGDASLEIAQLYIYQKHDPCNAARHLKKVCKSKNVTQDLLEQARRLLDPVQKR